MRDLTPGTARQVVRRLLTAEGEDPPDDLGADRLDRAAVEVSAGHRSWIVLAYPGDEQLVPDNRYALLEVESPGPTGSARRPDGYAVPSDGEVLRLADPADLGQLWARIAADDEPPATLAALAARYLDAPGVDRHQNLVVSRSDLSDHLADADIDAVPAFTELTVDPTPGGGGLRLAFCTFFLLPPGDRPAWTVGLNRWELVVEGSGLTCQVDRLATGLRSSRYSPRP